MHTIHDKYFVSEKLILYFLKTLNSTSIYVYIYYIKPTDIYENILYVHRACNVMLQCL